jgi:hypothetical protein
MHPELNNALARDRLDDLRRPIDRTRVALWRRLLAATR